MHKRSFGFLVLVALVVLAPLLNFISPAAAQTTQGTRVERRGIPVVNGNGLVADTVQWCQSDNPFSPFVSDWYVWVYDPNGTLIAETVTLEVTGLPGAQVAEVTGTVSNGLWTAPVRPYLFEDTPVVHYEGTCSTDPIQVRAVGWTYPVQSHLPVVGYPAP